MSDIDFSAIPPGQLQSVLDGPAIPPPAGVVPNFDERANGDGIAVFAIFLCTIAASIAFILRIYARFWKLRQQHFGDYIIIVLYGVYIYLNYTVAASNQFLHQWDMRGKDVAGYLKNVFIGLVLYSVAILLVKTAILIEWIRVFVPLPRRTWFYWTCLSILGINILFYIAVLISWALACRPFSRFWNKIIPGQCIDIKIVALVTAVIDLILDIATLLLPQRIIWNLNMSTKRKLGISAVFTVGIAACLSAAFRIQTTLEWQKSRDMSYHFSAITLWGIAEITWAILVFSIPAIPMAFKDFHAPMWFSSWRSWVASSVERLKATDKRSGVALSHTNSITASQEHQCIKGQPGPEPIQLESLERITRIYQPQGKIRTTEIVAEESSKLNLLQGYHYVNSI
ncbi:hypothetical protein F4679DRAFT_534337 [Xylaria curta]|nr:hypothetical protein F4679DRAFT_534337 [Xylaria curta]